MAYNMQLVQHVANDLRASVRKSCQCWIPRLAIAICGGYAEEGAYVGNVAG